MQKVIDFVKAYWKYILAVVVIVGAASFIWPANKAKAQDKRPTAEECKKNPKIPGCEAVRK